MTLGIGYWLFGEKWCAFWMTLLLFAGLFLTIRHIIKVILGKDRKR